MRNYFNYFTEIEDYFVRKRGKNLLVSPLDWSLIELWKDTGVPLHVVLRGIDRSFESAARRQRNPPRTLFYCHPAVMEAFDELSEAALGESEGQGRPAAPADRTALIEFMEALLAQLRRHDHSAVRQCAPLVEDLLAEVRARDELRPSRVDRDLTSLAGRLAKRLEAELPAGERRELDRQVASALKPYRKRLSEEMFEKLRESHRQRLVRERFGLPEMTIL